MPEEQLREHGIVLYSSLYGEYDKRLVVLTEGLGKITVFSNGARRTNSRLGAASQSFVMGRFDLRPGRGTYTLTGAEIEDSFRELTMDPEQYATAAYVTELAEYYTREGISGRDELNLLYITYHALLENALSPDVVRSAFVYKLLHIEGEAPGVEADDLEMAGKHTEVSPALLTAIRYIYSQPISGTYSFRVSEGTAEEMLRTAEMLVDRLTDRPLRAAKILKEMRSFRPNP